MYDMRRCIMLPLALLSLLLSLRCYEHISRCPLFLRARTWARPQASGSYHISHLHRVVLTNGAGNAVVKIIIRLLMLERSPRSL